MIAAGRAGARLHPPRPGRREGLARPTSAARKVLLVFYPLDFSPVCSGPALGLPGGQARDRGQGRRAGRDQRRQRLRPQGLPGEARHRHAAARRLRAQGRGRPAYGAYIEEPGIANRSLVLVDEDGAVEWVHESPTPLEIPGANLIFDALAAADASELTSAAVPPAGREDHVRGEGPELIVYADLGCPHCARPGRRSREREATSSSATSRSPASTRARRPCTPPPRPPAAGPLLRDGRLALRRPRPRRRPAPLGARRAARARPRALRGRPPLRRGRRAVRRDFESGIRAGVTATPAVFDLSRRLCTLSREREREF